MNEKLTREHTRVYFGAEIAEDSALWTRLYLIDPELIKRPDWSRLIDLLNYDDGIVRVSWTKLDAWFDEHVKPLERD